MKESNLIRFTKVKLPYGWLGNMSPYPVIYNGKEWRTTEALFQALRFAADDPIREEIRKEKSPMGAKLKAKANKDKMVITPTSELDIINMWVCISLKVEQHDELHKLLLETEDKIIVEDVTNRRKGGNHEFWGARVEDGNLIGENKLGELWMDLRAMLQLENY